MHHHCRLLNRRAAALPLSWSLVASLGVVASTGCGGGGQASNSLVKETVTSSMTMGNMKVTKGTAEVALEGMAPDELSYEEDDLVTDTDPNADDQSFTITEMKSGATAAISLNSNLARATLKQGGAMVQVGMAPDGSFLWNGMPVAAADLEAKVKAEPAFAMTTPGMSALAAKRLKDGSFVPNKAECKWMAHRNQFGRALGCLDASESRYFQRVALGIGRQRIEDGVG